MYKCVFIATSVNINFPRSVAYSESSPALQGIRKPRTTPRDGVGPWRHIKMMLSLYCFHSKTGFYEYNLITLGFIYSNCPLQRPLRNAFSTKSVDDIAQGNRFLLLLWQSSDFQSWVLFRIYCGILVDRIYLMCFVLASLWINLQAPFKNTSHRAFKRDVIRQQVWKTWTPWSVKETKILWPQAWEAQWVYVKLCF